MSSKFLCQLNMSQQEETISVEHIETGWAGHDCPVCKIGKVVPEKSTKESLTIYGRNGTRVVTSTNYR